MTRSRWVVGLGLGIMIAFGGCASSPCVPEIRTVEVNVPVPVIPHVKLPPAPELPPFPAPPGADARPADWARWYADMSSTAHEREAILAQHAAALRRVLATLSAPIDGEKPTR